MFSWFKRRRRQRILATDFPSEWLTYLQANVVQYRLLTPPEQAKLRQRVQVFVAEKTWVGCGGLVITDEMKVTIAAQACLLVLGIEYEYHYDRIQSILVYPNTYLHPPRIRGGVHQEESPIYGEAWHRGPIILSWKNTKNLPDEDGGNLVFHEFAHHLDDLDGGMDGTPPLERDQEERWDRVVDEEYHRLVRASRQGRATLLNQYGASNRAEFFAVATEYFFERPIALREQHQELYQILSDFYRQDPAQWHWESVAKRHTRSRNMPDHSPEATATNKEKPIRTRLRGTDAFFSEGVWLMNEQRYAEAVAAFDKTIEVAPDDAEAIMHRASALLKTGDVSRALTDATAAIQLDGNEPAMWRTRARCYLELAQYELALADCQRALNLDDRNGESYRLRGLARTGLGEIHRALRDFGNAIHFNADLVATLRSRAEAYDRLGEFDKAKTDREKAQRLDMGAVEG